MAEVRFLKDVDKLEYDVVTRWPRGTVAETKAGSIIMIVEGEKSRKTAIFLQTGEIVPGLHKCMARPLDKDEKLILNNKW